MRNRIRIKAQAKDGICPYSIIDCNFCGYVGFHLENLCYDVTDTETDDFKMRTKQDAVNIKCCPCDKTTDEIYSEAEDERLFAWTTATTDARNTYKRPDVEYDRSVDAGDFIS